MTDGIWGTAARLAAGLAGASSSPCADWMQATTNHFVVYSNGSEADLRKQVIDFERLDGVMRHLHRLRDNPEAASNKPTVFVVPDVATVPRLCGRCAGASAGL